MLSLQYLDDRRAALGMSYADLARRSGVSLMTVRRILGGAGGTIANVDALAESLGVRIELVPIESEQQVKLKQAREKARKLVALVQGTSALEAQAVGDQAIDDMIEQTTHELMAGSSRRVWAP